MPPAISRRCGWRGAGNPGQILLPAEPRVGALALALGADVDAAPLARLTVIHKVTASRGDGADRSLTLDMPANLVAEGGPVLDAAGALLGMATIGANNEATVIPHSAMARMLETSPGAGPMAGAAGSGSRCSQSPCLTGCAALSARRPGVWW